jgi:hypothetical protein
MPPKKVVFVCSDKEKLPKNKVRNKPGICFKKGLRAGFAAGISKAKKQVEVSARNRENAEMAANDMNIRTTNNKPSIKEILDRINPQVEVVKNGKRTMKKQKNDDDLLISNVNFNVPELTRTQKKAKGKQGMIRYLIENKGYRP